MLSNAYFLAKFRFDTAENEPAKNLQNLANFSNFANPNPSPLTPNPVLLSRRQRGRRRAARRGAAGRHGRLGLGRGGRRRGGGGRQFSKIGTLRIFFKNLKFAISCKILAGSFSAVSKRIFAKKYAFDNIFQALQDLHLFAPLQSQNFRKKSV